MKDEQGQEEVLEQEETPEGESEATDKGQVPAAEKERILVIKTNGARVYVAHSEVSALELQTIAQMLLQTAQQNIAAQNSG